MTSKRRSPAQIAKLLDCSGFCPEAANAIIRYARRSLTPRQRKREAALKKALGELTANMSEGDRQVLGKFIHFRCGAAFDAGLRIGLMTHLESEETAHEP